MRRRAIPGILTAALAASAGAGGCQVIAQLNVLEVTGTGGSGTGGSTTTSGSSTTSSSTTSSSTTSSSTTSSSSGMPACGADAGMCTEVDGSAMGCHSCVNGVCAMPCDSIMCILTIPTDMGPSAVQCNDSTCAGKTFTCAPGPFLCELDCNAMGSCHNTTLVCGDGPCRIKCAMMGCGPTTLTCGKDSCDTSYWAPPEAGGLPVNQACGPSCDCTQKNNM